MKEKFNNQFATQRLLQEQQGPFYVVYNKGYGQGKGVANDFKSFPSFEAAQTFADEANNSTSGTFSKFQKYYYVVGSDHEDFEWISQAAHDKAGLDKEIGEDVNMEETSTTSGAGAYLPKATVKKKTNEQKDVEPKLAAGPADIYMKKKWGWKDAPSIPNRPSKGGFIYKQLFEDHDQGVPTVRSFYYADPISPEDQAKVQSSVEETLSYLKGEGYIVHQDTALYFPNFSWAAKNYGPATGFLVGSDTIIVTPIGTQKVYKISDSLIAKKISIGDLEAYRINLSQEIKENHSRFKKETNETEWPSEVPSRYGEYIFKLVNVMPDGAKYDVIDVETGKEELGGRVYGSVETLKNAAADLVKPKGGTQSTQLEENTNIPENIVNFAKKKGISAELNMIANWVEKAGKRIVGGTAIGKNYNTLILDLTHQGSEIYYNMDNESIEVNGQPVDSYEEFLEALTVVDGSLNENYSRFKKETKTRTNEQQLHAAMRLAEKKIHEANRILEYTTQLRTELTETKVNKNTQKLMEKITRGIAEAYGKMKKLK